MPQSSFARARVRADARRARYVAILCTRCIIISRVSLRARSSSWVICVPLDTVHEHSTGDFVCSYRPWEIEIHQKHGYALPSGGGRAEHKFRESVSPLAMAAAALVVRTQPLNRLAWWALSASGLWALAAGSSQEQPEADKSSQK